MNQKIKIVVAAVMVSLLILLSSGCTGKSIQPPQDSLSPSSTQSHQSSLPSPEKIADYFITPSFKVSIDAKGVDYGNLITIVSGENGFIQQVNDCERWGASLQECVDAVITIANEYYKDEGTAFMKGGCAEEEQAISAVRETYDSCKASTDDTCLCDANIQFQHPTQNDITLLLEQKHEGSEQEEAEEGSHSHDDELLSPVQLFSVTGLDTSSPEKTDPGKITLTVPKGSRSSTFSFYKKGNNLFYVSDNKKGETPRCAIPQRTIKFCVQQDTNTIMYGADGHLVENINYKFALSFPDITPPAPLKNILIRDTPLAEDSVILTWDKPEDKDIKNFYLFSAPITDENAKAFSVDTETMKATLLPVIIPLETAVLIEDNVVLDHKCGIDLITRECKYSTEFQTSSLAGIALNKNQLYYFKGPTNYYLYIIDTIEDNVLHRFTLIAEDVFGNIVNNVDENQKAPIKGGTSNDDLPPGEVSITSAERIKADDDSPLVRIRWDVPLFNVDHSPSDDIDAFIIKYDSQRNVKKNDVCQGHECTAIIPYIGPGSLRIGALDGEGNLFDRWEEITIAYDIS